MHWSYKAYDQDLEVNRKIYTGVEIGDDMAAVLVKIHQRGLRVVELQEIEAAEYLRQRAIDRKTEALRRRLRGAEPQAQDAKRPLWRRLLGLS